MFDESSQRNQLNKLTIGKSRGERRVIFSSSGAIPTIHDLRRKRVKFTVRVRRKQFNGGSREEDAANDFVELEGEEEATTNGVIGVEGVSERRMAGNQIAGDGLPASLAGMSKNQLYDIMCQMKTLIEQNKQQARQILIQNPALTRALFQAQIMLGMVQSPQAPPTVSSTTSRNSQPPAISNQQSNIQAASSVSGQIGQNTMGKRQPVQTMASNSQSQTVPPPNPQTQPMKPIQSHPLQQEPKAHFGAQSTPMSIPQSSQVPYMSQLPQHISSPPPSHHQSHMPSLSTQSQQSVQNIGSQYLPLQPPLQPPLPPQPRPQMPAFPHQVHAQMGPNLGFQQPSGPQYHSQQQMFHPGTKPPSGMGPSFQQGHPSLLNQPSAPSLYQGGNPHLGMEFNQAGSSKQTDSRGSNWMPGLPENTMGQLPGPPSFASQMGPGNQPPRAPPLTPDLEKALLQQVMSLTPEQINLLPTEQRNQVLQLQQMLRQ
ncbi:hypothetical protein BUALT_Bualt07G0142100 [Buddleja alternifolia]|uniref:Uncharacterized protein n=1 Tax=Buddleja alternifolia TaxID=168488 RepID=A0AAV6XHQ1_9LAMI|nr:hypothetical protein BUALT_Bualt07G0142100 [Buddleja alternifolia]